jgi:hypothetical protein
MPRGLGLRFVLILAGLGGCGDDTPAYVAGDYTIAMTARANGCGFDNWTEGTTTENVMLTLTQEQAARP